MKNTKDLIELQSLIEKEEKEVRLKNSGLPPRFYKPQEFIVDQGNAKAVDLVKKFIGGKINGVFLYGGVGTGKTLLTSKILHEYDWKSARFVSVPKLLAELRDTFNNKDKSCMRIVENLVACELLILDDLGAEKVSDWTVEILYLIVNGRYENMKKLIVTSNCPPRLLSQRLSDRIISRIMEMCQMAKITSADRRQYV